MPHSSRPHRDEWSAPAEPTAPPNPSASVPAASGSPASDTPAHPSSTTPAHPRPAAGSLPSRAHPHREPHEVPRRERYEVPVKPPKPSKTRQPPQTTHDISSPDIADELWSAWYTGSSK